MKRIAITIIAALLVQFVALTLVVMTPGWTHDAESMRIHFIAGFALIGLCVGAASGWFAPSVESAAVVAGAILLLMHVPDIPNNLADGAVQLTVSLISAIVPLVLFKKYRRSGEPGVSEG